MRPAIWMLVALLLPAPGAWAEDEPGGEAEDLEVDLFFAPAETVTVAARHEQPLSESPSAVTVLTREDIAASGARTLPEILRLVPNMDIYMAKPMWYDVGVRGRTTDAADTLLLLVNGRDVTMEFFGFPLWLAYPLLVDDVERIEVIRGPGSALYGANAYAGVVHIVTRKPGTGPPLSFSVRGGQHGQIEMNARGTGSLGPVALAGSLGFVQEDLWTGRGETGRDILRWRLDGGLPLGAETDLSLELGGFTTQGILLADLGEVRLDDALALFARSRFRWKELVVQAFFERVQFDLDLGVALYYKSVGLELARLPEFSAHTNKLNLVAQHGFELFHNRLTYGAEYVRNDYHGDRVLDTDPEHRVGVFVQDEIEVSAILARLSGSEMPPLLFTVGLRFDENTVSEWELSPRAALVFRPVAEHSLRFGYAHAFLKPTFFESSLRFRVDDVNNLGFDEMSLANPDLQNQSIDSLELGATTSWFDERLVIRLDLAYNWYRSQIWFNFDPSRMAYKQVGTFRVPDLSGPGLQFENDPAGQHGHDVELQVLLRPTDRSRLFAQAGYRQIFNSRTGAFSDREPVLRLAAGGDLTGRSGWTASVRAFFCSAYTRDLQDPVSVLEPAMPVRIPATFLLNARVSWRLSFGQSNLESGVEAFNLLGSRHRELAGAARPPEPDWGGERLDRKIVLFLRGEIW